MKGIHILLIEDNRLLGEVITTTLNRQSDFRVVAVSGGDHNSLLKILTAKPGVVLMDPGLRNQNGLRVVASLRKETPKSLITRPD